MRLSSFLHERISSTNNLYLAIGAIIRKECKREMGYTPFHRRLIQQEKRPPSEGGTRHTIKQEWLKKSRDGKIELVIPSCHLEFSARQRQTAIFQCLWLTGESISVFIGFEKILALDFRMFCNALQQKFSNFFFFAVIFSYAIHIRHLAGKLKKRKYEKQKEKKQQKKIKMKNSK